jgi:hypothetical protein
MVLRPNARSGERRHQAGRGARADEQHRYEEQPAAEKDRGEQAILDRAELVADDTDEPQEGDAGKRHEVEAQPDESTPMPIGSQRLQTVGGEGNSQHRQRHQ